LEHIFIINKFKYENLQETTTVVPMTTVVYLQHHSANYHLDHVSSAHPF